MSTPSETAVRVNQGHYSHYSREALESALDAASNHPSESVNRRYIVPLQEAYTFAMAECDRLRADKARLDWLYSTHGHTLNQHGEANLIRFEWEFANPDFRAAIDAAISATQPSP